MNFKKMAQRKVFGSVSKQFLWLPNIPFRLKFQGGNNRQADGGAAIRRCFGGFAERDFLEGLQG